MMQVDVCADRLTRQELSWLLAQEARGAAKALREGVTQFKPSSDTREEPAPGVETTLDALDDAIFMLGSLQPSGHGVSSSSRRGRIDLAALLCEVAPNARIALEPGGGTEVFGEENDLRRMLHVLVSQTNSSPTTAGSSASPEVQIRRQGEWIRVSVELGPDSSATAELERRWLSRMATRHGGRVELEKGMQSVYLPADGSEQREVSQLKKELEQAQKLGEAYARELAQAFSAGEAAPPSTLPEARSDAVLEFEVVQSACSAFARVLRSFQEGLRADITAAAGELSSGSTAISRLDRRLSTLSSFSLELTRVAEYRPSMVERLDVAALLRALVAEVEAEANVARRQIRFQLSLQEPELLSPAAIDEALVKVLSRALLDHATAASPNGGKVVVQLRTSGDSLELRVRDEGPAVPEASRLDLLSHRVDPSRLGRPIGIALLVARSAAEALSGELSLGEAPEGGQELTVRFR